MHDVSCATLLDFMCEDKNVVAGVQQRPFLELSSWSAETWPRVAAMNDAFGDGTPVLFARRQVLQLSSSLTDQFELRLS